MTDATTARPYQPPAVPRSAWNALIVLMAGMFMALLDTTIVNVALPTIQVSLDASRGDAELDHQRATRWRSASR